MNSLLIFSTWVYNTVQEKHFVTTVTIRRSLRQVRPVIFRSTKFCQGLPNFKDAVVLPQSRTNFCQV